MKTLLALLLLTTTAHAQGVLRLDAFGELVPEVGRRVLIDVGMLKYGNDREASDAWGIFDAEPIFSVEMASFSTHDHHPGNIGDFQFFATIDEANWVSIDTELQFAEWSIGGARNEGIYLGTMDVYQVPEPTAAMHLLAGLLLLSIGRGKLR